MSGLHVAEVVELDDHSEKESVYPLSVQILITEGVMEAFMKCKNVISNAVQVSHLLICY